MKIIPIASESLGVRSMATYVDTRDVKVLIDPGVALAPDRYGLKPNKIEFKALDKIREKINNFAKKADVIVISHYHYDHYTPFFDDIYLASKDYANEIYRDKILLIKHPEEYINKSQKERAKKFLERVKDLAKKIEFADNRMFDFNKTIIKFSPPFPHGKDDKLGYVIMTTVKEDQTFLHTSDIQGILFDEIKDYIIKEKPDIIFIGGPPTYLIHRYGKKNLEKAVANIKEVKDKTGAEIIMDHHLLRDKNFRKKINIDFKTVAEFLGKENLLLEAYRKDIKDGKVVVDDNALERCL
ncbi:MBL fold metallo-hydrolase [Methanocaldococcus villosus]|uniref:MBL fold metallo-hydrolase n=1 Tax=Methanocaldococcus villosus TaxID=667126 RepID=UPI00035D151F|nr:MBL fold metallo-hydrolase [Methanocaldococcus villosus]